MAKRRLTPKARAKKFKEIAARVCRQHRCYSGTKKQRQKCVRRCVRALVAKTTRSR